MPIMLAQRYENFQRACGIPEYHSQPKNVRITTLPADRIGSGGGGKRSIEGKEGGELFTEAVIADEAGPSKRHGKRFY